MNPAYLSSSEWIDSDHPTIAAKAAHLPSAIDGPTIGSNALKLIEATAVSVEFGMTAYEERHGEGLSGRLDREEPDVLTDENEARDSDGDDESLDNPYERERTVGRLVDDDEGARADETAEVVGHDVGTDLGGYSSEESAMHIDPDS